MKVRYFNKKRECISRKELKELQFGRLKYVLEKVYNNVPLYRQKFDKEGIKPKDIKKLSDLAKLPFTTKDDLRKAFPYGLFAEPLKRVVRVHSSSGTTGLPTVVGYTKNDIKTWSELTARVLTAGGLTNEDIVQIAFGYSLFTGAFGMHYGAERVGATVIPISSGNTQRQVLTMRDFKTTALICTPSYALQIYDTSVEMGIEFKKLGLKLGFFGAEPWSESMRKEIEEKMGIFATDNYGLSEVIGPGFSGECIFKRGLHIWEDHFIAEIVDTENFGVLPEGEKGELVVTSLTKEALPVIRYRTKDLTVINHEKCECGRTMARMERVKGRSDDMLIIKGVNVFPSQIEDVVFSIAGVQHQYQLIVDKKGRLDFLELQIEINNEIYDNPKKKQELFKTIKERLLAVLGLSPEITLLRQDSLPKVEGKAKRVIDKRQKD
ncbi:MAG: phenylacetate--CoA ligase [Proteobacteria bacterium]|nr:phenylacetate--CoA ligase [Pseudomonadota bacterium]